MKGLKARLHVGALFGLSSAIGIAMSWTQALGQSTPDAAIPAPLPEPVTMTLFGVGVGAAFVARKFIGRK